MDFKKLDLGATAKSAAPAIAIPCVLDKFRNGAGEPLRLDLMPTNTPEGERELRKWKIKFGIGKDDGPQTEAAEDELDRRAALEAASNTDLLARVCVGWNLSDGKADVPCTLENRRALFDAFPDVAEAFAARFREAQEAVGKSKKP